MRVCYDILITLLITDFFTWRAELRDKPSAGSLSVHKVQLSQGADKAQALLPSPTAFPGALASEMEQTHCGMLGPQVPAQPQILSLFSLHSPPQESLKLYTNAMLTLK